MRTIILQIGNSDDKLSQAEWGAYCREMQAAIFGHAHQIHFSGGSEYHQTWQNACWVFEIVPAVADALRPLVVDIRAKYRQDSVAWTEGETAFV